MADMSNVEELMRDGQEVWHQVVTLVQRILEFLAGLLGSIQEVLDNVVEDYFQGGRVMAIQVSVGVLILLATLLFLYNYFYGEE